MLPPLVVWCTWARNSIHQSPQGCRLHCADRTEHSRPSACSAPSTVGLMSGLQRGGGGWHHVPQLNPKRFPGAFTLFPNAEPTLFVEMIQRAWQSWSSYLFGREKQYENGLFPFKATWGPTMRVHCKCKFHKQAPLSFCCSQTNVFMALSPFSACGHTASSYLPYNKLLLALFFASNLMQKFLKYTLEYGKSFRGVGTTKSDVWPTKGLHGPSTGQT